MPKPRATYEEKRDAEVTNEPFGEGAREGARTLVGAFVVHLHDATRSHYDLRVEANGLLASFAVPRGPSLDPEEKRLAVHTEDHPIEYLDFEDVIPEGEYGGGPMIVWDRGAVRYLEGPSEDGLRTGKLDMMLSGRKLRGRWALVRLKNDPKAWLLFKKRDPYAIPGVAKEDDVTRLERSVLSGLTVSELETRRALGEACEHALLARGAAEGEARASAFCESDALPPSETHVYEVVLEGLRVRAEKDELVVRITVAEEPRGEDVAEFYPEIVRSLRALAPERVTLEGTIVAFDAAGKPSVSVLAERARRVATGASHEALVTAPVTFVVDEVSSIGRATCVGLPFDARRATLDALLRGDGFVQKSVLLPGDERLARALALDHGLRALAAKPRQGDGTFVRVLFGPKVVAPPIAHGVTRGALRVVRVTNPGKIYFPERGYEKARVVGYYRAVAEALLPHVRGRPVTLVRYPDGIHGKNFFQWNVPPQMPSWVRTVAFSDEESPERTKRGFLVDDTETLLYIANLGAIPVHVFSCKATSLARCDYVAIDFDVKLSSLAVATRLAHTLKGILSEIGLVGFPKTSGQTGLHVLVPLGPGQSYDTARALVQLLGRLVVDAHPDLATMERAPQKRGAKVYVDTGQTGPTRTLVCAYSLRAVPDATVSFPLAWDDVHEGLDPTAYTLETVPELVAARTCPMAGFDDERPDVPLAVAKIAARLGRK